MSYRRTSPFVDRQQRRGQWREPTPFQSSVEGLGIVADRFDVVHGEYSWGAICGADALPHLSSPAKAGDPVSRAVGNQSRGRSVLDTPLSRSMTATASQLHPYSAGLAAGGAPVEARAAAAFFSTIRTAMIEPS